MEDMPEQATSANSLGIAGNANGGTDDQVAMQVVRHIRALIESGKLRRGERLAPEREFAKELGISRASLRAGVGYLAAMGVLKVRHGVGTFVDDGPPALSAASFELMYSLHGFTPRQIFEARLKATLPRWPLSVAAKSSLRRWPMRLRIWKRRMMIRRRT
jgi:DNA-binding transcriptional MocR family regulator